MSEPVSFISYVLLSVHCLLGALSAFALCSPCGLFLAQCILTPLYDGNDITPRNNHYRSESHFTVSV